MAQEAWRPMGGFPGYSVSDRGRVRNNQTGTIRKTALRNGYLCVSLWQRGRRCHPINVHRAVALAFLGPCPEGLNVCHGDGDKLNNELANLRYDTPQGNSADRNAHGNTARGEKQGLSRLTEAAVVDIRRMHAQGEKQAAIAEVFGVATPTIANVVHGRTWKHVQQSEAR